MPSTFSPALRLELIGNGEQAANWGNTTNTNLGTLLEQAITGVGNITIPTNAGLTLFSSNGASDDARNAVLVVASGVSLTATPNLIVPTSNKFYAVRNATTGGQSILVKTAAGTGVTLANGFTQLMYCDGTNVVAATSSFNATTNTVSVNVVGNLTGAASSNVLKAGDTMTGDLTITKVSPLITLNKTASSQNAIFASQTAGSFRWIVVAGDSSPESGSNAGSNFGINRYNDAGSYIDTPLSIIRSTGVVNFPIIPEGPASNPTTDNQLARKAYVDTKAISGAITASGLTQATSRILGRTTAGTGAVEEISIGAGLTLSAGSLTAVATGSVTSVGVSGGTTGLTTSGSPVTTSGTITLGGTLGVANGGTGITTVPSNGQIPIGNGSGYSAATLTAGSNIVITNSAGGVTIAATGGGTGSVTSVGVSGGTTGLTTSGGPVTTSGTITLAGTLALANGGTGATSAAAARTNLGSTTVGDAVFVAASAAAARTATGSAASGAIGSSGVTMNTSRILGRTTAAAGAVEEISLGSGLSLSAGVLSSTGSGGSVTSVGVSGGTTGLTTSGGPITTSGTITLAGTLAVANGGTGITTVPSNGQIPIGNGTGYSAATLTAGSNISITNSAGGVTVAVSGTLPVANGGTGATTAAAARTSLGSTTVGDAVFIAATAAAARTSLGSTTVGDAVFIAANAAAARTATGSAASGAVGSSGVTMNTSRLLGRTTASTGAVEEISVGAGLSFSAGSLALTSGDLQFNSGYGSVATAYGCRAWVNFDGTGTVSIRASGNVSSITDNGAGTYRVNFATALVDANYSCVAMPSSDSATAMSAGIQGTSTAVSTTGVDISTWTDSGTAVDRTVVTFAAFR